MSLAGSLEDVSVADVLQFVHLGGRSGTLALVSPAGRAEIGFHRGRIISARGPTSRRLGDLLLQVGAITAADLEAALRQQKRQQPPPPLGLLLVQMGALSQERLKETYERHVEQAVYDVVAWSTGSFEFVVDDLKPVDDLAVSPGDILPDIHINTQMVLLEAARIFDERSSPKGRAAAGTLAASAALAQAAGPPAPDTTGKAPAQPQPGLISAVAAAPGQSAALEPRLRLQLLTEDRGLADEVERILAAQKTSVVRVTARDAGNPLPGEPAPVVLVDLASGKVAQDALASLRRTRPQAAAIALVEPGGATAAYEAGALAVVPRDPAAIAACFRSVARHRRECYTDQAVRDGLRAGFAKLRRLLGEFRSGLVTATVSLNLMNIISESVERAVLFVVRKSDLMALGAFGHSADGRALAERSQGLRVELEQAGPLAESVRDGRSRTMRFEGAGLPECLTSLVGPPSSGECAIFPVLGGRKVIATVYADNGRKGRPLDDLEFLELATSQVGMAYENELLRRHVGEAPAGKAAPAAGAEAGGAEPKAGPPRSRTG